MAQVIEKIVRSKYPPRDTRVIWLDVTCNEFINKLSNKECRMSKYEAYSYLNISRAKFDNLVKEGKLPKGKKQQGFKELSWTKRELDEYIKQLNIN